ncbi:anthrone oxygenase family protein [Nocardioides alcanivorans]|uniref:anthrone oxygenase family protein n=1 Tax=Nocardioides alcanivorans TaxID=2897352 RepID=UPI002010D6E9
MTMLGTAVLVGSILATAMASGLLYSFAHSVMPGLGTLDDREFLTAFQRIDAAIYNPWMMSTFVGSPVLTVAALVLYLLDGNGAVGWLAVALVLTIATVIITGAVHLPLNAATQDAAPEFLDAGRLRSRFETRWVRWNVVRTVTSIGSLAALCGALLAGR